MLKLLSKEQVSTEQDLDPGQSSLVLYPVEATVPTPFIFIFPGGGYTHWSVQKEGIDIAEWLNSLGYSAGILFYQLENIQPENLLADIEEAADLIQQGRTLQNLDAKNIGVIGFSAGGHLAALASNQLSEKIHFALLCYPVITFCESYTHMDSRNHFLNTDASKAKAFSAERKVHANTPPTFLWHTAEDKSVPVKNSLLYAAELSRLGIPFSLNIFPKGAHGLGLAKQTELCRDWPYLAEKWLNTIVTP